MATITFEQYRDGYVAEMPRNWFIGPKINLTNWISSEGGNYFQDEKGERYLPYPTKLINSDEWTVSHCGKGFVIMKPKK